MPSLERTNQIDAQMEHASRALAERRYLECATIAKDALLKARAAGDFERMARIVMPLLESQRYLRQEALARGDAHIIASASDAPSIPENRCYLFAPMLVGADALQFRIASNQTGIAPFVLTREPTTSQGLIPIVGVAQRVVRVRVEPPEDPTRYDPAWFALAHEKLGDQAITDAINACEPADPRAWFVDDLLDRLDACPEHEKLLMRLADACKDAMTQPAPTIIRRRPLVNDPFSF